MDYVNYGLYLEILTPPNPIIILSSFFGEETK